MKILKSVILALSVFFIFVGCTATSAFSRFRTRNDNKKGSAVIPDTARYNSKKLMTVTALDDLDSDSEFSLEDDDDEFDNTESVTATWKKDEVYSTLIKAAGNSVPPELCSRILNEAVSYLNTPYKYGGTTANGIDCSAFTQKVYENSIELQIPRSTREQFSIGEKILKGDELQFGDLVFFKTKRRSGPGHVGIYIGDNKFMHASRKKGVMVSSLDEQYWKPRYMGARRLNITE